MHFRLLQWKLSERTQLCIYAFQSVNEVVEHSYILICNSALSLILMCWRHKHYRRGADKEKLGEIQNISREISQDKEKTLKWDDRDEWIF